MSAREKAKAAELLTPGGIAREPGLAKEALDALKEPAAPRDPIVDDEQRAAEGVVVPPSAPLSHTRLPRPPPPDGRP